MMNEFNQDVWHEDDTGYNYTTNILSDLAMDLCVEHGWRNLKALVPGQSEMIDVEIEAFIRSGAPRYIFDGIELFSKALAEARYPFQQSINRIFAESSLSWRLSDDLIFQVNSEYMAEVLASTSQILASTGIEGAKEEFQEARSHFDTGDYKGTIHHANLAIESTMKGILNIEKEKPGRLIRKVIDVGIIPSYYEEFLVNFEQILRSVNIARNEELGAGHGQGAKVSEVPSHLAELVLNFCGSLIVFLVNHHIDSQPQDELRPEDEKIEISDDDIPF